MANARKPVPDLGTPPTDYQFNYMLTLTRILEQFMVDMRTPGDLVEGRLFLVNCPTSGAGLRANAVYVDADGVLRLVRSSDVFAGHVQANYSIGKVVAA